MDVFVFHFRHRPSVHLVFLRSRDPEQWPYCYRDYRLPVNTSEFLVLKCMGLCGETTEYRANFPGIVVEVVWRLASCDECVRNEKDIYISVN